MVLRQALNFGIHFAGGVLVGLLAVAAVTALLRKRQDEVPLIAPEEPPFAGPEPATD
jgi:hypothetical protein